MLVFNVWLALGLVILQDIFLYDWIVSKNFISSGKVHGLLSGILVLFSTIIIAIFDGKFTLSFILHEGITLLALNQLWYWAFNTFGLFSLVNYAVNLVKGIFNKKQ